MTEFSSSICIAFPVAYPGEVPDAHCTLLWLGYMEEFTPTREQVQAVLDDFDYNPPRTRNTLPPKIFGQDDERVVVLPLDDSDGALGDLRIHLERELLSTLNVGNASQYTQFVPHVTVQDFVPGVTKLYGFQYPETVTLGKAELWWGDDHGVPQSSISEDISV